MVRGHTVIGNVTVRYSAYDFPFDFRDFLSKVADFNLSHLHLAHKCND